MTTDWIPPAEYWVVDQGNTLIHLDAETAKEVESALCVLDRPVEASVDVIDLYGGDIRIVLCHIQCIYVTNPETRRRSWVLRDMVRSEHAAGGFVDD